MDSTVKILQPSGILNAISGAQLRRDINDLATSGKKLLVLIDLQYVNFMDSSGLGTLVSILQLIRASNGQLFICSVTEPVKMLFDLTKMSNIFKIFKNQDEFNHQVLTDSNESIK